MVGARVNAQVDQPAMVLGYDLGLGPANLQAGVLIHVLHQAQLLHDGSKTQQLQVNLDLLNADLGNRL